MALSSLSNNLNQTLASGERVLSILEEEPMVQEVSAEKETGFTGASCEHVNFSYEEETILRDYPFVLNRGRSWGYMVPAAPENLRS